jgi:predicted MFS family arabinose efflux permease
LICALLVTGTVLGLSGIDLVLPAIPILPAALGGDTAAAQLVIAAYVAGTALGLVVFGWLADHFARSTVILLSLSVFAAASLAATAARTIEVLVALRFIQGVFCAGPAVIAPGVVRALFDEARATRILGLLGSIESLVPGLAPIAGSWLVARFDWRASFLVTGLLALACAGLLLARRGSLPVAHGRRRGSYAALLARPTFLRYGLTYALVLASLLTFVFGAPVVITRAMGGTIGDFIMMQAVGVATFIAAANGSGFLAHRVGPERLIRCGVILATASACALLAYAGAQGREPAMLLPLWIPFNIGMGLVGPYAFIRALAASGDDDARASALIIVTVTAVSSATTALVAPFLEAGGLFALALSTVLLIAPVLPILLLLAPKEALAR